MAEAKNENGNEGGEARILKQGFPVPTDIIGHWLGKRVPISLTSKRPLVPKLLPDRKGPNSGIGPISSYLALETKWTEPKIEKT